MDLPRLYLITDVNLSGLDHAEQVSRMVAGGASFIQLREKSLSPAEFFVQARRAIAVARQGGARIIINDRVDIALAVDADGVHLGQDDLPPVAARSVLGPEKIIGFSTHNYAQAMEAASFPVDYIAVGPIFATSSKYNPDPVVGLKELEQIRAAMPRQIPIVAIGGINFENVADVIRAGADSVAVISAIVKGGATIKQRTAEILDFLETG
jgi:thiamine-phosphate pyrophosphorylase